MRGVSGATALVSNSLYTSKKVLVGGYTRGERALIRASIDNPALFPLCFPTGPCCLHALYHCPPYRCRSDPKLRLLAGTPVHAPRGKLQTTGAGSGERVDRGQSQKDSRSRGLDTHVLSFEQLSSNTAEQVSNTPIAFSDTMLNIFRSSSAAPATTSTSASGPATASSSSSTPTPTTGPAEPQSKIRYYRDRGFYRRQNVLDVVRESPLCHVAFQHGDTLMNIPLIVAVRPPAEADEEEEGGEGEVEEVIYLHTNYKSSLVEAVQAGTLRILTASCTIGKSDHRLLIADG